LGGDPVGGVERGFDVGFVEVEAERRETMKTAKSSLVHLHTRLDLGRGWWRSVFEEM
jgi:hypothetical protein